MNGLDTNRALIKSLRAVHRDRQIDDPVFMSGYADASFKVDTPHKGGGWGIWVRDKRTRILRADVCPGWVQTSSQAEACAVWAAIHTALTHLDREGCNILVIKTDCQDIARYYGWAQSHNLPRDDDVARIVRRSFEMGRDLGIKLVVKWVKGHQRKRVGNTPGYLNHRVDRLAWDARVSREGFKRVIPISDEGEQS